MRDNLGCTWKYLITLFFIISVASSAGANSTSGKIVINEMLPNPASDWNKNGVTSGMDDEFIELFNSGKEPVDISGYNITDLSLGYYYIIPNGTIIKPEGFWVVFSSESNVFQRNSGDIIWLYDPSGNLVDEKEYNSTTSDVSFARIPDGGNWTTSKTPTPGKPNH